MKKIILGLILLFVGLGYADKTTIYNPYANKLQYYNNVSSSTGTYSSITTSSLTVTNTSSFGGEATFSDNIIITGTVDGRDISNDGAVLDQVIISTASLQSQVDSNDTEITNLQISTGSIQSELTQIKTDVATDTTTIQGNINTLDSEVLKKDGSVELTADWDAGSYNVTSDNIKADYGIIASTITSSRLDISSYTEYGQSSSLYLRNQFSDFTDYDYSRLHIDIPTNRGGIDEGVSIGYLNGGTFTGGLSFYNNTTSGINPAIQGLSLGGSSNSALNITALSSHDILGISTMAALKFKAYKSDNTNLATLNLFNWANYDSVLMTMKADGSLGIGDTTPDEMLHVAGNIKSDYGVIAATLTLTNQVVLISTDTTMTSDSNTSLVTEKAIKTYVDNNAGGNTADSTTQYSMLVADNSGAWVENTNCLLTNSSLAVASIVTAEIKASGASGLSLEDDTGNGIFIEHGGQVGIGVITPSQALEVVGTVEADGFSINGTPLGTSSDTYWNATGSDIYYSAGDVGIGVTHPAYALDVYNTSGPEFRFQGDSGVCNAEMYSYSYNQLFRVTTELEDKDTVIKFGNEHGDATEGWAFVGTGADKDKRLDIASSVVISQHNSDVGTTQMTILQDGSVGIGTTSPDVELEVNGEIKTDVGYVVASSSQSSKMVFGTAFFSSTMSQGTNELTVSFSPAMSSTSYIVLANANEKGDGTFGNAKLITRECIAYTTSSFKVRVESDYDGTIDCYVNYIIIGIDS